MAYTISINIALGAGHAGLTLKAQLFDTTGAAVGSEVTTGFIEKGTRGNYLWTYAGFPDGFRGGVSFIDSADDSILAITSINPEEIELIDDLSSASDPLLNPVPGDYESGTAGFALGRIGNATIEVNNPVVDQGRITIVQGDDYFAADGRAIDLTQEDGSTWPDLTDAVLTFTARFKDTILTKAATCTNPGEANQVIRVELTSDETSPLIPDREYKFDIQATLDNDHIATLARGVMIVLKQQTE